VLHLDNEKIIARCRIQRAFIIKSQAWAMPNRAFRERALREVYLVEGPAAAFMVFESRIKIVW